MIILLNYNFYETLKKEVNQFFNYEKNFKNFNKSLTTLSKSSKLKIVSTTFFITLSCSGDILFSESHESCVPLIINSLITAMA